MAISYFAGTFNALDYAYGTQGSGAPSLQAVSGSTATGAYTLTCSPSQIFTAAGKPIPISHEHAITTRNQVAGSFNGWFQYQPMWTMISTEEPDIFD